MPEKSPGTSFPGHAPNPPSAAQQKDKFIRFICKHSRCFTEASLVTLECREGIVQSMLSSHAVSLHNITSHFDHHRLCRKQNIPSDFKDFSAHPSPISAPALLFLLTGSKKYDELLLSQAAQNLPPGGVLYIGGETDRGIKSLGKKLGLTPLAVGGGGRLFKTHPAAVLQTKMQKETTHYNYKNKTVSADTYPGLFSYKKVDRGTQLLIHCMENIQFSQKKVLDMGCGSGILSRIALEERAQSVTATDVSAVALRATAKNTAQFSHITCCPSSMGDTLSQKYDIILTNPPFHEGKNTRYSFARPWLEGVQRLLHPQGTVYLVANSFLPYETTGASHFDVCEIIAQNYGFTVYKMYFPKKWHQSVRAHQW
ncbi:MAG: methyltransferase [Fibrobacterota bacterium]